MNPEKQRLHDFIARELQALAGPFKSRSRAEAEPQIRKVIADFLTDLAHSGPPHKTDVTATPTSDGGLDVSVTTNDPLLIEQMANSGMIEDPAALGMIKAGDGWMWPPRVALGATEVE